jgi:hypothetical protein
VGGGLGALRASLFGFAQGRTWINGAEKGLAWQVAHHQLMCTSRCVFASDPLETEGRQAPPLLFYTFSAVRHQTKDKSKSPGEKNATSPCLKHRPHSAVEAVGGRV